MFGGGMGEMFGGGDQGKAMVSETIQSSPFIMPKDPQLL